MVPDTEPGNTKSLNKGPRLTSKPHLRGVDMGQHLNFISCGKAVGGKAKVRTGLGKSDRPGS